jgi:glycosidase
VAVEAADPDSLLATYRRLLAFRARADALRTGAMERLASGDPDVLAWTRTASGQRLLVLVNFVGEERRIDLAGVGDGRWSARVGTQREPASVGEDGFVLLRPDEAVIFGAADA